jgi:mRNA interferase MazF
LGRTVGTEIYKIRPCLVISNNRQNEISSRIIVIPLTSQAVSINILHVKIRLVGKLAYILPEQIRSVGKKRIKGLLGEVSKEVMQKISKLLHLICELEESHES